TDRRDVFEEADRIFNGHIKHVKDGFAFILHLKRLSVKPFALTDVACYVDVGQKVHLDTQNAGSLTVLAATAGDVKTEATGLVPAKLRLGQFREKLTDRRKKP